MAINTSAVRRPDIYRFIPRRDSLSGNKPPLCLSSEGGDDVEFSYFTNRLDGMYRKFQEDFALNSHTSAVYECGGLEYQFCLTPEGVMVTVVDQNGLVVIRLCKRVYDWEKV